MSFIKNETAFNNAKYIKIQKEEILKRIARFGDKLYLEFGGKLFDDLHAERVLPGFEQDSKLKVLLSMKEQCELIMVINSQDIKNRKIRADLGITYDVEVERLIFSYKVAGLNIAGVVFSFYEKNKAVDSFIRKLKNMKINVFKHYEIKGYPDDIETIVSEIGLGKNEYVPTTKPLIVVTAPGPGSGKLACCLSQLYHDKKLGIKSGYAKYETFPVWNLSIDHPINLAYEAATIDLFDKNMIDPYHLTHYGVQAVNYNRDIEAFPLVQRLLVSINGECLYKSPTDMGVNKVGFAIENDEIVRKAAKDEIIRRYYGVEKDFLMGKVEIGVLEKAKMLMTQVGVSSLDRKCVAPCITKAEKTGCPTLSIELKNGKIVLGKRSDLLTATSAAILNALKELSGIPDEVMLLERNVITPIQELKVNRLHNVNPKIHAEEILIALAIQANFTKNAKKAMSNLKELSGCEAHSSCILANSDLKLLNKLGIRVTEEPKSYIYKVNL